MRSHASMGQIRRVVSLLRGVDPDPPFWRVVTLMIETVNRTRQSGRLSFSVYGG